MHTGSDVNAAPQVKRLAAFACALLLLACSDPDSRPVGPGGGPIGPGGGADAGAPTIAKGRICEIQNFDDTGPCQPLLDSGLFVGSTGNLRESEVEADGSFELGNLSPIVNEHIFVNLVSSDEWLGGEIWADALPGQDILNLEIPVIRRATRDAIVEQSGADPESLVVVQVTSYSGLPLSGVSFSPYVLEIDLSLQNVPNYGGPSVYSPGTVTTETGTAVFFATLVDESRLGFDIHFTDAGTDYMTHGSIWSDSFTIIPVQLSR